MDVCFPHLAPEAKAHAEVVAWASPPGTECASNAEMREQIALNAVILYPSLVNEFKQNPVNVGQPATQAFIICIIELETDAEHVWDYQAVLTRSYPALQMALSGGQGRGNVRHALQSLFAMTTAQVYCSCASRLGKDPRELGEEFAVKEEDLV